MSEKGIREGVVVLSVHAEQGGRETKAEAKASEAEAEVARARGKTVRSPPTP